MKILHFADAHLDAVTTGKRDPETGFPVRVLDFIKSLNIIIDTAIEEKVDLVLFAGDAFKDRDPNPAYLDEWNKAIMRLSRAEIPTVLLVGNHDKSSRTGVHVQTHFDTFDPPYVMVIDKPGYYASSLTGAKCNIVALPWVHKKTEYLFEEVDRFLGLCDQSLPTILLAHVLAQDAVFGSEMTIRLGDDLILPKRIYTDPRFDYVALGDIHRHQTLNEFHPPAIYSGSIERVDFGEAGEEKVFIIAEVTKGRTTWEARKLPTRKFVDCGVEIGDKELDVNKEIASCLPTPDQVRDAMVRVKVSYPADLEKRINWVAIENRLEGALSVKVVKDKQREIRLRLPEGGNYTEYSPFKLFNMYLKATHVERDRRDHLRELAKSVIGGDR